MAQPNEVKFQHSNVPMKKTDSMRKKKSVDKSHVRSHLLQDGIMNFELQKEEEDRIASEKLASTIFTTSGLSPMDGMMPPLSPNARSKSKSVERAKSIEKKERQEKEAKEKQSALEIEQLLQDRKPKNDDRIVRLNVGGTIFETRSSTLAKYPKTLLGAMFSNRNEEMVDKNETFFDRDPRVFEVILNFYRTGRIMKPNWIPIELMTEELLFWSMDIPQDSAHHRISVELLKMEYKYQIFDAKEYRKIARHKLLSEHHATLVKILKMFSNQVEKSATLGHNGCNVIFYSPLHYNDATPRELFDVISKDEIRELIVELLEEKQFLISDLSQEYSKTKATDIIGLDDQVTNYNDPKFFSFEIRW